MVRRVLLAVRRPIIRGNRTAACAGLQQMREMDSKNTEGESMVVSGPNRTCPGRVLILLVLPFLLLAAAVDSASGGSGKSSKGSSSVQQGVANDGAAAGEVVVRHPGDLMREIHIPRATEAFFNGIYARRHKEIQKLIDENPEMIWPAIDIFLDALPGLRSIPQNGGKLLVDGRVYEKAEQLLARCEKKASPEFGDDLKKMRTFIEKRTKHIEGKRIAIDLN